MKFPNQLCMNMRIGTRIQDIIYIPIRIAEECVILAIAATQTIDPIILIMAYASSVAAALIGITAISMKLYQRFFQYKMIYYSKHLPKITAIVFFLLDRSQPWTTQSIFGLHLLTMCSS